MLGFLIALTLSASVSSEASASATKRETFKQAFTTAEQRYLAKDFSGAIRAFREADALIPTPEVAFDLAQCHDKLGNLGEAISWYRRYLRRAPDSRDGLEVAERLSALLRWMESKGLGLLEIEAEGEATVSMAGEPSQPLPVAFLLPKGDHEVNLRFATGTVLRGGTISVGKATLIKVQAPPPGFGRLAPETVAANAPSSSASPALSLKSSPRTPTPTLRKAGYWVLAASAAALATGAVLGALSNFDAARLRDEHQHLSYADATAIARGAGAKGRAANILLGAGAAGALTGTGLIAFSFGEPKTEGTVR
jgi:tetratricopeptide (TPR) repeat protein